MEQKNYIRIPFNNAFVGLSHRFKFEDRLQELKAKVDKLIVCRIWLNSVEMLDIDNTISCLKGMSVNQVMDSEILIEVVGNFT